MTLDDGVEASATEAGLDETPATPVLLAGLHTHATHVRQRLGQAGVQLAVHPLAARALFGVPAAELSLTDFDARAVLGRASARLADELQGTAD